MKKYLLIFGFLAFSFSLASAQSDKLGGLITIPNDATKYLDGTGAFTSPSAPPYVPLVEVVASFESSSRYDVSASGTASNNNFGDYGYSCRTSSGGGYSQLLYASDMNFIYNGNQNIIFTASFAVNGNPTDEDFFIGISQYGLTVNSSGVDFTGEHIGFKLTRRSSGTYAIYATQANGSTETASSSMGSAGNGYSFKVCFRYNAGSSVDYWVQSNTGTFSGATNLSAHLPTDGMRYMDVDESNIGATTSSRIDVNCMTLKVY